MATIADIEQQLPAAIQAELAARQIGDVPGQEAHMQEIRRLRHELDLLMRASGKL